MKKRFLLALVSVALTVAMCTACGVKPASYVTEVFAPVTVDQSVLLGDLKEFVYADRDIEITSTMTADATVLNRTAFSVGTVGGVDAGERAAAARLKRMLVAKGFQDADPDATNPGVHYDDKQPFVKTQAFTETIKESTGLFNAITKEVYSQNIIATIPTASSRSRGLVILAAHYDNLYGSELVSGTQGHGVYSGGLATAAILSMADMLHSAIFPFDVQLVLFGASEVGQFGSAYYYSQMSESTKADTLMMYNLDLMGGGDYNYMFVEETATDSEEFLRAAAMSQGADILRAPKDKRVIRTADAKQSYTHYGLMSDHYVFYKAGINTASFFGLNWGASDTYGIYESEKFDSIIATANDTLFEVSSRYPNYLDRTATIIKTVVSSLSSQKFVDTMLLANGQHSAAAFWSRNDIALYVFAGMLVVFQLILVLVVMRMKKRKPRPQDLATPPDTQPEDVFADYSDAKSQSNRNDKDDHNGAPPPSDSPFEGY